MADVHESAVLVLHDDTKTNTDNTESSAEIQHEPSHYEQLVATTSEDHVYDPVLMEEIKNAPTLIEDKPKDNQELETDGDEKLGVEERIFLALSSARKLIAWATIGKIGPGYLIAPTLFLLTIHIMMFILGIQYSGSCRSKPLVPVAMVLMGGDGSLKSLSFLLQFVIVIQTKMKRSKAFLFVSESSVIDTGLNSLYVFSIILSAAGVYIGGKSICQLVLYEFMFFYTTICLCILGLICVLIIWKLVKPNKDEDFIDKTGEIV